MFWFFFIEKNQVEKLLHMVHNKRGFKYDNGVKYLLTQEKKRFLEEKNVKNSCANKKRIFFINFINNTERHLHK